eukprot:15465616-Alexandrium_andersonii.AAC.1
MLRPFSGAGRFQVRMLEAMDTCEIQRWCYSVRWVRFVARFGRCSVYVSSSTSLHVAIRAAPTATSSASSCGALAPR